MYPAETDTVLMPRAWQAAATSIAYSKKITGSLYVKATDRHPVRTATSAIASGKAEQNYPHRTHAR
jgi:hypothetical protein